MARILVTEEIADGGLERLRQAGHTVDIQLDLSHEQLLSAVKGAHALIIRSATDVNTEVLEAGTDLIVVGRAGVGLDNVDVDTATRRGVMVCNAPESNIVSAAEQTMALLLSVARNVPQAHAALVQGRWERSKWEGVDFLTVHLPKTKETIGIIGRDMFLKAKPELRVINVARGGIVDEEALATAVKEGLIAGAALDVFTKEPMTESPLFSIPQIVVTPHLGASTREAQDKAGDVIADMVQLALAGDFVPFAVNIDASDANETLRPFLPLAERLGQLFASLVGKAPSSLEISATGEIGGYDTRILTLSALKGFFASITGEQVTYVNAPQLAKDAGCEVRENNSPVSTNADYVNLVTLKCDGHNIAATLVGPRREARLVLVDDHITDVPPANNMLVVRNDDRPGVIGVVGTLLGNATVNIADMDVGKALKAGTAVMVIVPTAPVAPEVVAALRAAPGILDVAVLTAK